jgi:predicted permease
MLTIIAAIVPIFLLIVMGFVLRRLLLKESHWVGTEQLVYYVLFPALLFRTLARAKLSEVPLVGVGGALLIAVLVMAALCLALRPVLMRRQCERAVIHLDLSVLVPLADICRPCSCRKPVWRHRPHPRLCGDGGDDSPSSM